MNLEKITSIGSRILFSLALILLAAAVAERLVNMMGYTILRQADYSPWRLLEFASVLLIFVISMVLRQIREELRQQKKTGALE